MHPMFRTRTGTGALYGDNQQRGERLERTQRRSRHPRLANGSRLWSQDEPPAPQLDYAELAAQSQAIATEMLELMREIGLHVTFSLRRREPLPAELLRHDGEALGWFFVLYTLGLLDRQGHWLGPAIGSTR